jgi:hypothetical protein
MSWLYGSWIYNYLCKMWNARCHFYNNTQN